MGERGSLHYWSPEMVMTKYETWSVYVLSWLDDNRAYLSCLHAEFEENRARSALECQRKHARNDARLLQLLDELKTYV